MIRNCSCLVALARRWSLPCALLVALLVGCVGPKAARAHTAASATPGPPPAPDTTDAPIWERLPLVGSDSASNTSWYALPLMYYTPETSVGGGFSAGYFFGDDPTRISSVAADLSATLFGEYQVSASTELYLNEGRYRLKGSANAARTPTSFFGVGPHTDAEDRESYTQQLVDVTLHGARRVSHALHLGLRTRVRHAAITTFPEDGLLDRHAVTGARGSTVLGIGPTLIVDDRSRTYYPSQGHYVSMYALFHPHVEGAQGAFTRLVADFRRFTPLGGDHVLALQAYGEATTGAAPFALLPKLGGSDRMRGYQNARFRDKVTATAQAEWRFPVWGPVDGAAFASVGSIAPEFSQLASTYLKPAGGIGMRYRLTDDGVHLRADVAVSPDGTGIYLTGSQPF